MATTIPFTVTVKVGGVSYKTIFNINSDEKNVEIEFDFNNDGITDTDTDTDSEPIPDLPPLSLIRSVRTNFNNLVNQIVDTPITLRTTHTNSINDSDHIMTQLYSWDEKLQLHPNYTEIDNTLLLSYKTMLVNLDKFFVKYYIHKKNIYNDHRNDLLLLKDEMQKHVDEKTELSVSFDQYKEDMDLIMEDITKAKNCITFVTELRCLLITSRLKLPFRLNFEKYILFIDMFDCELPNTNALEADNQKALRELFIAIKNEQLTSLVTLLD